MKDFESNEGNGGRDIHFNATQNIMSGGNNMAVSGSGHGEMHIHYAPATRSESIDEWMARKGIPSSLLASVNYFLALFKPDADHRSFVERLTVIEDTSVLYTVLAFTCMDSTNSITLNLIKKDAFLTHLTRLLFRLGQLPEARSIKQGVEKEYSLLRAEFKK